MAKPRKRKTRSRTTSPSTGRRPRADCALDGEATSLASDPVASGAVMRGEGDEHTLRTEVVTELATCLWYLKTKYFRRRLSGEQNEESDPRVRHALRRIDRSLEALATAGIRLVDPTGTRYPPGGEGVMSPLQFEPTPGISMDTVSETVRPLVFAGDRLVQRGEVFVSVPLRGGNRADERQSLD